MDTFSKIFVVGVYLNLGQLGQIGTINCIDICDFWWSKTDVRTGIYMCFDVKIQISVRDQVTLVRRHCTDIWILTSKKGVSDQVGLFQLGQQIIYGGKLKSRQSRVESAILAFLQ